MLNYRRFKSSLTQLRHIQINLASLGLKFAAVKSCSVIYTTYTVLITRSIAKLIRLGTPSGGGEFCLADKI